MGGVMKDVLPSGTANDLLEEEFAWETEEWEETMN